MTTRLDYEEIWIRTQGILDRAGSPRLALEALVGEVTRRTGRDPLPELASFDVEKEIEEMAEQVELVFREEPPPPEIDHLLIGFCHASDTRGTPPWLACHVTGQRGFRPDELEWYCEPLYRVTKYELQSDFLDLVLRADDQERAEGSNENLIGAAILVPAVGVVFRAAVKRLGLPYVVVVVTDCAECSYVLR